MAFELKNILTTRPFLAFLYRFIRLYGATFRLTVENEQVWIDCLSRGQPVLLCTWHQQFFSAIRHFETYRGYNPSLMISKSRDGEIISGVANRCGWQTVRGSSSRGGTEALRSMMNHFSRSHLAGHILDGPRGPAGIVKAGVIRLAHAVGAVIVPFHTEAARAWYVNSWDNFLLPKPFTAVNITFGSPIAFPPTTDIDEFESQRLRLEEIMKPWLKGRLAKNAAASPAASE